MGMQGRLTGQQTMPGQHAFDRGVEIVVTGLYCCNLRHCSASVLVYDCLWSGPACRTNLAHTRSIPIC
jgi:hypothetical protein